MLVHTLVEKQDNDKFIVTVTIIFKSTVLGSDP